MNHVLYYIFAFALTALTAWNIATTIVVSFTKELKRKVVFLYF